MKERDIRHLILTVNKWHYSNDLTAAKRSDDGWTGKAITVYGKTKKAHFLKSLDFEVSISQSIKSTFPHFDTNELVFGYLGKYETELNQNDLPFISSNIPVSKSDFDDLRNCLFHWSKTPESSLIFSLGLYGLDLGEYSLDPKWPDRTNLQIVEFEYILKSNTK